MSSILRKLKVWKEDRESRGEKTRNMIRNGGALLKELIGSSNGKYNPYRVFSAKELQLATNNFDTITNLIFAAGYYKVYAGVWQERPISVVKYKRPDYEYCINNMVYASQMVHNYVVKLIGCCLETEIPLLVFEYFQKGTLADRLYGPPQPHFLPLLLKHRLKIAMDIGNVVAYLHSGFRRPIIFRDFKTSLIMFDEENVAKLFDFSLSISIPDGETHINEDRVMGTHGFVAPEYMETGILNEKADVYSFSIFLLELLTGRRNFEIVCASDDEVGNVLPIYLKKYFEENRPSEIIDRLIMEDRSFPGKKQLLHDFVQLILECSNLSPVDRPTMVDVTKKLRRMYRSCM